MRALLPAGGLLLGLSVGLLVGLFVGVFVCLFDFFPPHPTASDDHFVRRCTTMTVKGTSYWSSVATEEVGLGGQWRSSEEYNYTSLAREDRSGGTEPR